MYESRSPDGLSLCQKGGLFMTQIYVGIDIAKNLHYASIIDSNGEVLHKTFSFENNASGFQLLLSKTKDKSSLCFGMESTAHYSNNLSNYLLLHKYSVTILNPLQTHALRKTRMRDVKNDKVDSQIICLALSMNLGTPITLDATLSELNDLCKCYQNITKMCSKTKIQLIAYLDQTFPELAKEFKKSTHGKAVYALLKEYPLPSNINKVRIDKLTNILTSHSRGKYKKDKALRLKELCQNTVGIQRDSLGLQIQLAISQIELYSTQKAELKAQITVIVESLNSPIMTIPGMGHIHAAMILSSIKDSTLFSSPSKVLAYASLDPRVRQSGNFQAKTTRMSKRGSSMLRYALIYAAHNVCKHEPVFHEYYIKKSKEGKTHYCILGHAANKLTRLLYKLLTTNQTYDSHLLQ